MALARITLLGLHLVRASSIYETEPVGYADQPWFLNQVIEMAPDPKSEAPTRLALAPCSSSPSNAAQLLRALLAIESEIGRERSIPDGPRVIDIDLLLFGEMVVDRDIAAGIRAAASRIVVPHPRMHLRRFVLEPLCEIAPELVHPLFRKSYRQLLSELKDGSEVRLHS